MAASLIGGAAVGAVFGELLKAVLQIKDKAVVFKQTLVHLRSTLIAIAPIIKEIEQHNNDLGRPKEELELLIRQMEEGTELVCKCSKIHRLNYVARIRYQEQLEALVDSLVRFFIIDMQAQTARDQKETLLKVTRILSAVNKFPFRTNSQETSQQADENAVENNSGLEDVTQGSTSSDPGLIGINVNDDELDTLHSTTTENEATETSSAREATDPLSSIAWNIESQNVGNKILGTALYDFIAGGDDELNLTAGEEFEIEYEVDGWYYVKKMRPGRDGKMAGLVPFLYVNNLESCNSTATTKSNEAGPSSAQETIEPQNSIAHEVLGQSKSYEQSLTPKKRFPRIRLPKIGGFNRENKKENPESPSLKLNTSLGSPLHYCAACDTCIKQDETFYRKGYSYCNTCYKEQVRLKGLHFDDSSYSFDIEDLLSASAEVLGKGSYGTSYKVTLENGRTLAVKRLKEVLLRSSEFERQLEHMQQLLPEHPNVLPLRAYHCDRDEQLLIYDYIALGSFSRLLHGETDRTPLDWDTRMKISLGAAMGIAHIHSARMMNFIHGNIKSSNILVTEDFQGCISDFGLRNLSLVKQYKNDGYEAPEIVETGKLTQECDVYSFGVILCEMLTGKSPSYISFHLKSVGEWIEHKVFDIDIDPEDLIKEEQMVQVGRLAMKCIAKRPDARPSMVEVVKRMQEIKSFSKF